MERIAMGAAVMDRPTPPPGFVYEDDPAASLPPGFEIEEMQPAPGPVPARLPSPAQNADDVIVLDWEKSAPLHVVNDRVLFDPARFDEGVELAFQDQIIDKDQYNALQPAVESFRIEKKKEKELMRRAGENPEFASFVQGFGRGGAVTAGALGSAKVAGAIGALTGPAAPIAVPVLSALGAIGGGIAANKGYNAAYEKLAELFPDYETALAAKELKPGYNMAGELVSVGLSLPVSAVQAGRGLKTAYDVGGAARAAQMAATAGGAGAVTGVSAYGINEAVEGRPLTASGAASAAGAGMFFGGFFINNRRVTDKDLFLIALKSRAGGKLSPAEQEIMAAAKLPMQRAVSGVESVRGKFPGSNKNKIGAKFESEMDHASVAGFQRVTSPARVKTTYEVAPKLGAGSVQPAGDIVLPRRAEMTPVLSLPGPAAGQFTLGRSGVPMPPPPAGPIAAGGATRAALPTTRPPAPAEAPPPPAGFELVVTPDAPPPPASMLNTDVEPVIWLDPATLKLSDDVPNFKRGADPARGVVPGEELQGEYRTKPANPLIVWQRLNGDLEVITGRHRLDLAKRTKAPQVPVQIVREAEGFTAQDAMTLDAELNILDGQGKIEDYATYFRNSQITEAEANAGGLLSREKGRAGFAIGKGAGNDLFAAYQAGRIAESKAVAIARAAPGDEPLQQAGMKHADKLRAEELPGFLQYLRQQSGPKAQQTDLFGSDDSAIAESMRIAKEATAKAKDLGEQIAAVRGAAKRPEQAAKLGVDVRDPEGLSKRIAELETQRMRYSEFWRHPEVLAELGGKPAPLQIQPAAPKSPATPVPPEPSLFAEKDMPFSLSGQTDRTSLTSEELRQLELQAQREALAEAGQTDMFGATQQSGGPAQPGPQPRAASAKAPDWALQPPETPKGKQLLKGIERQDKKGLGFRDLVDFVNDAVGVEMRRSKSQTSKKHPAHYMATGHLARTRNTQSQINFHEAGHGVQYMLLARNPGIFDPVAGELMAFADRPGSMASKGPDKAYKIGEGVAEWLRMRITDPQAVEGMQAGAMIEAGLNQYYPGVAAAIRDAARAHQRFQNLPAAARWAKFNQEAKKNPSFKEIYNAALRLGNAAADALASGAPLSRYDRQIARAILKNHKEVGMSSREAERAMRRIRNRTSEVMENYNLVLSIGSETQMAISGKGEMRGIRMVGPDGKMKVLYPKTWQEIVKQVPGPLYEQFEQAGWALESLNRWAKDKMEYPGMREGVTPEDLQQIVAQAKKYIPEFVRLFKEVQGYFDALLHLKYLGGLKATGEVEKMRRRELYWPMPRAIDTMANGGAGRPRGQVTSGDYRAFGSGEAIMDLNTVAEQRTREAMTAFYWNQLGWSIYNNFLTIARDTKLPMEARILAGRAMVPMKMEQKVAATLSREEVQRMVYDAVLAQRAADLGLSPEEIPSLAMQFKPEDINLAFNFKDIYRPVAPKDVNIVSLLQNGERKFFQIQDEGLFMMFARPDQVSSFMRGVSWLIGPTMQNWKRNITQSLPFSIANLAGDVVNQMMLNPREAGWVPGGATMLGMWNKFTQKYPQVFQEGILLSRVEPSSVELVNAMRENAAINWLTEGWYQATDKDPTKRLLKTLLQPSNLLFPIYKAGDAINLATGGRTLAPLLETATREGAAVAVLMRGGSDREAMNAYWGVTGRFNEHAGTSDARAAMSLPGFFNPMVQAVRGAGQLLTDPDPAIRTSAWAKLMLVFPAMFGGAAVARYLMMDDDQKARERERPLEDRMNYYDVAGFRLRFPYGPEGAMGSFVYNAVMDDLLDRPKADGQRTGIMLLKRIADVGTPLQFLGPQLNAVTEAQMNWSNFQQRHIVSPWMVGLPASEQYSSTTPEFYRKLGKWMDYSPAKMQYIVRQGISRQTDEVIRLLSDVEAGRGAREMFQEAADIPFVGRMFIREPLGFGAASMQSIQELDDRITLLNKRMATAGYSWIKSAPIDQLPVELQAIRNQWDSLEMLRAGSRQLELISSLATASKLGGDALGERNYRRMMVLYSQAILAANPEAAERIEMAIEMLEHVPEASPEMKQSDYIQRRF
jgi:hypothetical protein